MKRFYDLIPQEFPFSSPASGTFYKIVKQFYDMNEKTDIESRLKEAELYCSMGLLDESIDAYEGIMSDAPGLAPDYLESIKEKIALLKEKRRDQGKRRDASISPENVFVIRKSLPVGENPSEILDSATALKELGLLKEAIVEYKKLFQLDYRLAEIIPQLAECLIEVHSPSKVLAQLEEIIHNGGLSGPEKAEIKFRFGLEMERKDYMNLACDLYKAALDIAPENREIKKRLDFVMTSISTGSKYDYLINQNLVKLDEIKKALALSKKTKKSVESILIDDFKVRKEEVGKSLSFFHGCPFKGFDPEVPVPSELISNLKKSFLLHDLWVPMSWGKEGVEILADDPMDLRKKDHIKALIKTKKIIFSVGIREDIVQYINHFFEGKKTEEAIEDMVEDLEMMLEISFEEEEEIEKEEELDEASSQVVRLVDQVLVTAYRKNASDIHIEPSPVFKRTDIRFRIDGVCQQYIQVPNSMARGILSRLKIMAGLDIAERRLPQDGKIKFRRKGISPFELRLATLPTTGGFEDAVLRILAKSGAMKLDDMGLSERNLKVMRKIIIRPYGLVLVVGPTGSGKTTILHSSLGYINKPGIKIWTAEDPVEITQPGLRQVEAKPKIGLDFKRIMRAFLRADPDVIMIGEMRDQETASIGVEASLTGHLVFSTLHTNSAPETVTRLLDMGLNPLNFSDAFLGVLAQRLVRSLCNNCREAYHPSEEEFEEIVTEYGKEKFEATGISFTSDLTLYRPRGCEACSETGYRGRLGIHELMEGTPQIKRLIKKKANSEDLFAQAIKEGMSTLKQDGIQKVFLGLTDVHEVRRVCVD